MLKLKGDKTIWAVLILLALISTLVVYSSIVTLAIKHHQGNTLYYLFRHGFFLLVGLGFVYLVHQVKYTYFSRLAQIGLYISIPLLIVTMFFGANYNQADRWLMIPVINQTFQTSDLAKLALIMYLARALSIKGEKIKDYKNGFLMVLLPVVIVCGLIFRADFSTSIALLVISMIIMFIGGAKITHLLSVVGAGVVVLAFVFTISKAYPEVFPRAKTWIKRIECFFKQCEDDPNATYQVTQSKIAIAAGGIIGKGPGKSTQRNFLPHPYSDFIYAIVLEEYGLLGGFLVIILYLILLYRCIRIATNCENKFGAYLVMGICFMLVFQAIINMAVAVNLFPVTGQTLPMISMGGTSIWFTCLAIGVILSVSVAQKKKGLANQKMAHVNK